MIQTTLNIKAHGKIESLTKEFSFPYKENFTVYVRPKDNAEVGNDIVLSVKLHNEEKFSNVPIAVGQWSPLSIKAIAGNQNDVLNSVDLYWGGQTMPKPGTGRIIKKPTEKALAYTGEAQALVNAGVGTGTMLYKLGDGEWSENIPTATNAGIYAVNYKCASNDMYSESPTYTVVCQIAKASRTIAFTSVPQNVTVGEDYSLAATPSAGASDGIITYRSSNQEVVSVNGSTATGVAAGTCSIIASISGGVNYEDAEISQSVIAREHDYANDYLTFVPVEDSTFGFSKNGVSYSLDNGATWIELEANGTTPTVTAGSKILWKGAFTSAKGSAGNGTFSSTKEFDVKGNIMSLVHGDDFMNQTDLSGKLYVFSELFRRGKVRDAKNLQLPAVTLEKDCYNNMFDECASLVTAPKLPASTLADNCYIGMFKRCTTLVKAPDLLANRVGDSCYSQMFLGCTSLNYVKMIATYAYYNGFNQWLQDVAASGTLVKSEVLVLPSGVNGIPEGWTVETYTPSN